MEDLERLRGKKIIVTGGTGFVGSHLVENLVSHGAQVIVPFRSLDPKSYFFSQKLDRESLLCVADLKDKERIFDLVVKYEIEYLFHLGAQAIVPNAHLNPWEAVATNVIGTTNVLEAARLYPGIKAVIIASSDKAYGKLNKKQYQETDPLRGDHPYDVSKSSADLIAQAYWKTYQLPVVITRFGNIYGEGDLNFSRIIPGILKAINCQEKLEIRSDGSLIREYLYVQDVVNGYLLLAKNIKKAKGEAFNFGSKDKLSVIKLVKLIEKTLGVKVKYNIQNNAQNEIPYQSLDFSKIKKKFGWQPQSSIRGTIKKINRWYQKYFKKED